MHCKKCGVKDEAVGAHDSVRMWHDVVSIDNINSSEGDYLFGEYPEIITIEIVEGLCQICKKDEDSKEEIEKRRIKSYEKSLFPIF
jgi:hypothetical protein